jgi:beta-phosphoglucomutase
MIKAIIFDMDGVLIDAKEWHYEALNKALCLFGMTISRYDHLVTYDGLPTRLKLEMLSAEHGLPKELHAFINRMKQLYTTELINTLCKPKFHSEYALSRLRSEGYKLAVCSNSISETIRAMLSRAALLDYFEFFLSNEDVEKPKPHPEMYSKAIDRLGFHPKECLVIEDNEKGIKAAKEAGAHVFSVHSVDDVNYKNIAQVVSKHNGLHYD